MRFFNRKTPICFLLLLSVVNNTYAYMKVHHRTKHTKNCDDAWIVGAGAGAGWVNFSNGNTTVSNGSFAPPPSDKDNYTINGAKAAITQIFVGYRWHHFNRVVPYSNLFLQYRHLFNTLVRGNIDQYSLPDFENYKYQMNYKTDSLMLTGKFDFFGCLKLMPYLSGGIGFIVNSLGDYQETALANVTPRISPAYTGRTTTKFGATLGAGLDYILSKNVWLTLGYEHVFQGSIKSGPGIGTWSDTSLNFGKIKTDTVFLNITGNFPEAFR